ncbi:alpha/beta fold hydrolase [Solimonas flava]|uniref:alpha/beta fold hydrolase n=1 Tax=Solimonas flava TaxID=415849 RepID=UPI00040CEA16|nr:alpha/beta hydrolase [Solimonas flava]
MNHPVPEHFHELSAWQSSAGAGPILRGRRHDGPPTTLHFVHGNGFCGGVYWPLLRPLAAEYGLFCHDFEGHGNSAAPERFAGPAALAARIPQVIAEQRLPSGALIGVGHSYGAALTVLAAIARPDLFRALVLLDPILMPGPMYALTRLLALTRRNPLSRGARRRRDRWPSRQAAWDRLHDRGIYHDWLDAAFDCFIDYATHDEGGERALSCPKWLEAEIFDHPAYPWSGLRELRCPVLFLHGEQTYPFVAGAARLARRRLPSIEVHTQPGGHCFMQEDPRSTADTVLRFLRRHGL